MATEEKQNPNNLFENLINRVPLAAEKRTPNNLVNLEPEESSDEEIVGPAPKGVDPTQMIMSLVNTVFKSMEKIPSGRNEKPRSQVPVKTPEHSDEYVPEEDVDFEIELDFDSMVDEIKRKHDLLQQEVAEYKSRCEKLTALNGKLLTENLALKKRIHSLTKS